jgi:hypothetical protein
VCDECWLDVAMDQQHHKFRVAKEALEPRLRPISDQIRATSLTPSRLGADTPTTQSGVSPYRPNRGSQAAPRFSRALSPPFKRLLLDLVQPGLNSVCRICSHIFYGASMGQCTRCGGLCSIVNDNDLKMMSRYPARTLEEDVLS